MSNNFVPHAPLLAHFLNSCDDSFAFMHQEHGFKKFCGIIEFHKGRKIIKPPKSLQQNDPYLAICRLEKNEIVVEVTYDSHDLMIDSYVYFDFINRFSLSDILSAAKKNVIPLRGNHNVVTSGDLIIQKNNIIADCLRSYTYLFTVPEERLITRAINIRGKRMEHSVREQHKRNMEAAISRAARAFHDKDYRRVVELLKPFESHLRSSDKKKYTRAIDRLTNVHSA